MQTITWTEVVSKIPAGIRVSFHHDHNAAKSRMKPGDRLFQIARLPEHCGDKRFAVLSTWEPGDMIHKDDLKRVLEATP